MEDHDLRDLFDDVREDIKELRGMIRVMQLADADARADAKIVAGKLENAAVALANAAQAAHASDLSRKEAGAPGVMDKWAPRIIIVLLAIIAALVGSERVLPAIVKLLAVS